MQYVGKVPRYVRNKNGTYFVKNHGDSGVFSKRTSRQRSVDAYVTDTTNSDTPTTLLMSEVSVEKGAKRRTGDEVASD